MHTHHRLLTLAAAGALTLGLTACGDDEKTTTTTTPASSTTPSADAAVESATAPDAAVATVTEEAAASSGPLTPAADDAATSADAGAGGASAGTEAGVPELEEIWPDVLENAQDAESVHAEFSGVMDGADMQVELEGQTDDSNFRLDLENEGAHVEVRAEGDTYYLKGDEEFWKVTGAPDPAAPADRWVIAPPDAGIEEQMSFSSLWGELTNTLPSSSVDLQTSAAVKDEVDGEPAYHYTIDGQDAQVWVSADGEDHLLRAVIGDPEGDIEIKFSDWNEVEKVSMPKDAVPAEELMAG